MRTAVALVLLMVPAAVAADDPPSTIEGVAWIAGTDRRAARVTLHVSRPNEPDHSVVTDDEGRFTAPAPDNIMAFRREGARGPNYEVEAEVPGRWTWEPADPFPFSRPTEPLRKQIAATLRRPAPTIWRGHGAAATLQVECPPLGEVEVLVRGPDGTALADRTVQIVPVWATSDVNAYNGARFHGRTDAEGRFRMRWFDGRRRLRVTAPGVGYGSTRPFEITVGSVTPLETPPLARFGTIAGQLAPELAKPGTEVGLEHQAIHALCDAEGRFELSDVIPGEHTLRVARDGQIVAHQPATARAAPGVRTERVEIQGPKPLPPGRPKGQVIRLAPPPRTGKPEDVTWVEGTLRDAAGKPVAQAEVFVRAEQNGGLRMVEEIRKTTSDDRGHYEIRGPGRGQGGIGSIGPNVGPLAVVAHVKGRPPVVSSAPGRSSQNDRPATLDLMLADRGGSARITVLKEGKPLADAGVGLLLEANIFPLSQPNYVGAARGPEPAEIDAVLSPTARTGPDGVAHFADLLPGVYTVSLIGNAAPRAVRAMVLSRSSAASYGWAHGLGVAAGQEARTTLAVAPGFTRVRFLVLRPDARPVTNQAVSLQLSKESNVRLSGRLTLDDQGIGENTFSEPGVWSIVVRFRDTELKTLPINEEPFYEAVAVVSVSPFVRLDEPIRMVATRRDRGSLRVRLLDVDGRPAAGVVEVGGSVGPADLAASTNAQGEVQFADLPSNEYRLRGFLEAPTPPTIPGSGPWPEETALRGPYAIALDTRASVTAGRKTLVEIRAQPVGYLGGTLQPAPGRNPSDYVLFTEHNAQQLRQDSRIDPDTGRYLVGPVLAGSTTLGVRLRINFIKYTDAGTKAVAVVPGGVTRVDVAAEDVKAPEDPPGDRQIRVGLGGVSFLEGAPEGTPVTVVQADGTTPAFAAQALVFVPGQPQPVSLGLADADGRLAWRALWVSGNPAARKREGTVEQPTLVAFLPGSTGATVVPLEAGRPLRVVLPAPVAAEGTITVGGRPIAGDAGRFRVVAVHTGRGVLDAALGREVTVRPEGRFTLPGLTPGRYVFQAAREEIWVSPAVELVVAPGQAPPPLTLDISEPGEDVALKVVDPDGHPRADESLTLARPAGPLAGLWPEMFRTDASGVLILRGLPAGEHVVAGAIGKASFQVRPAPAAPSPPTTARIVARLTRP